MAKQPNTVFLEDYLRANSDDSTIVTSPPSSARAIIQAWAELRDCLNHQSFQPNHLQSLKTLISSQTSLHVADPQAKLLLSILSLETLSLPPESFPIFLRLLYIWVRKSFRPSTQVLDSAVEIVASRALANCKTDILLFSEAMLLMGAFSLTPSVSERSKIVSLERLVKILEEGYPLMSSDGGFKVIPNVLAGIGYALSSPMSVSYTKILSFLFGVWQFEGLPDGSVRLGLMILHLVEWVVSGYISSNFSEKISVFTREVLETPGVDFAAFAVLMGAAGVLRACNRVASSGIVSGTISTLRVIAENRIEILAKELISRTGRYGNSSPYDPLHRDRLLLQCLAVASARSGLISPCGPLLCCLASALLNEVFPMRRLYAKVLETPLGNSNLAGLEEIKRHLDSIIFKDAGAITGVFCNQYVSAEEENKRIVENMVWNYCRDIYSGHRRISLFLNGRESNLLSDLEKIAESAFLMVVVFAFGVTKQKLNSNYPKETQREVSLQILVSFSCVEYFRRIRLAEYMDTIRGVVTSIQESEILCVSFVESVPSYGDLTMGHECSFPGGRYDWCQDEVQTARVLFYLRVIPTLVEKLPSNVFSTTVAPTMFLYMGHPSGKLTRASHSLFAAFISSGEETVEDERALLKEQLSFYYVQRSLEGFPTVTPFEGMALGIAALVRHLPAGSPAIFYCIHSLVEKANRLCKDVSDQESYAWNNLQGESVHCKKILELLVHLLSLVDIQVLPELMKLLAQQVVELPKDGQNMVLSDLFSQVADSDDVTRKPTLVSWLQSLSYLCSQSTTLSEHDKHKPSSSLQMDGSSLLERAARL